MQLGRAWPLTLGLLLLGTALPGVSGDGDGVDPIGKVLQMMEQLATKIKKDAVAEEKAYKEYRGWCDETIRNTGFDIQTASQQKDKLEARIGELTSEVQVRSTKIETLAADISSSTEDLKSATELRKKEEEDFIASEKELNKVINTVERAIGVLQRELRKNAGAFAQLDVKSTQEMMDALTALVEAASFSVNDRQQLLALLQAQDGDEDGDDALAAQLGGPAAAAYKSKSGSIVDLLQDLKEKAQVQLGHLRKNEATAKFNYDKVKGALERSIETATKDLASEKSGKAAAEEGKATSEGNLKVAIEQLKAGNAKLESTTANCRQVDQDHEETVKSRDEELKVLLDAINIVKESSGVSFVQVAATSRSGSKSGSTAQSKTGSEATLDIARMVKRLAKKHHSAALAQLSSRIAAVVRFGTANGADPFAKVKQLIQGLMEQLKKEADNDASEKAYCDSEMAKTKAKKDELEESIGKLTAKIDQSSSSSAELKGQVAQLQADLATIAKEQADMDRIRQESHRDYVKSKADLEKGLRGIRQALSVLREYYASSDGGVALLQDDTKFSDFMRQPAAPDKHEKSGGAGGGIIGFLEVIESDLAKSLSKEEAMETDAQSAYEKQTQRNKIDLASKEKDVQYKTQEAKSLDKSIVELSSDRDNMSAEQAAVLEYWSKLQERCIAKPETYEERAGRRAAEINGLKEALRSLDTDAALLQRHRHGHIRGASLAPDSA